MQMPPAKSQRATPPAEGLNQGQQNLLDALAWYESVGLRPVDRRNMAAKANQSPTSSTFDKNVRVLSSLELVEYPAPGQVALTDAGRKLAKTSGSAPSVEDLHEAWLNGPALSDGEKSLLTVLLGNYPDALTRQDLAQAAMQSSTSSTFDKNVRRLSSLRLATYPKPGLVAANGEMLFPEGLV